MGRIDVIPLIPYTTYSADTTGQVAHIGNQVNRVAAFLLVGTGITGTTPTLDAYVQGAPDTARSGWWTSLPAYRGETAPNSIGGIMVFTQTNTASKQLKYSDYPMPYVRAKLDLGGTGPDFPCGIFLVCYED